MPPPPHVNPRDILLGIFQFAIFVWILLICILYLILPTSKGVYSDCREQCMKICIQALLNKTEL
jgi:hypothetical protein